MQTVVPADCVREVLRRRQSEQLLRNAQQQELAKRNQLLQTSWNLSQGTDNWRSPLPYWARSSHSPTKSPRQPADRPAFGQSFTGNLEVLHSAGPALCASCSQAVSLAVTDLQDSTQLYQAVSLNYHVDAYTNICNVFWKSSLTFHPFTSGDPLIDFGSLWPAEDQLRELLIEGCEAATTLRKSLLDLCHVVLHCGPLRALSALLDLRLIGINEVFEDGQGLLHKAVVAQNVEAVCYLTANGVEPGLRDRRGRRAEEVGLPSQIRRVLPETYLSAAYSSQRKDKDTGRSPVKVKVAPTLHEKQLLFEMAQNVQGTDELLIQLQRYQFDVNKETDENGDCLVHVAVKEGLSQLPLVSLLIKLCDADINVSNGNGVTALMLAAGSGQSTLVDALVCVHGAQLDQQDTAHRWTALHLACVGNHTDVVSVLVKRGADCNVEDEHGVRADDLALRLAATDCVTIVQQHRATRHRLLTAKIEKDSLTKDDIRLSDLYEVDQGGCTLLMTAARYNSCDCLQWLLLSAGAPVNAQHTKNLQTALFHAARWGHVEAVRILMRNGANPAIKDIDGNQALHVAVVYQQVAAVTELLQYQPALTGLHRACKLSASPGIQTALRAATERRQRDLVTPALFQCAVSGQVEQLYCLLEEGDNVNPQSGLGDWPLYLAVDNGHLDTVKLLIQHGDGLYRCHPQTGDTVLHAACGSGHLGVVKYVLAQCQAWSQCASQRWGALNPHCMLHALNYERKTPLVMAAEKGYLKVVELLLQMGASTSILFSQGVLYNCVEYQGVQYALETARRRHTHQVMQALRHKKALTQLKQLFLPQFDHNLRDNRGDTPLMVACALGKLDVIKYLLQSAVYELAPSPQKNRHTPSSRHDSDQDSGAVLEVNHTLSNTLPCDPPAQPISSTLPCDPLTQPISNTLPCDPLMQPISSTLPCDPPTQPISSFPNAPEQLISAEKLSMCDAATTVVELNSESDEEAAVHDNISSLLDSIATQSRGSVYVSDNHVNHVCARSGFDGGTVYHRVVTSGDRLDMLSALLDTDQSAVNIQDTMGLTPLHLCCKLNRNKLLHKFITLPYVDLNCRTLDGKLPEEMTTNKVTAKLVGQARQQQPSSRPSLLSSWPSSVFGVTTSGVTDETLDFEQLNTQFMLLKHNLNSPDCYL